MSSSTERPTVKAVYEALDTVKDPCMGAAGLDLSIVDLGLVYGVEVDEGGAVNVEMNADSPPAARLIAPNSPPFICD